MNIKLIKNKLQEYIEINRGPFRKYFGKSIEFIKEAEQITLLANFLATKGDEEDITYQFFIESLPNEKQQKLFNDRYLRSNRASAKLFLIWLQDDRTKANETRLSIFMPRDILDDIFYYLNKQELAIAGQACKLFHDISKRHYSSAPFPILNYKKPLPKQTKQCNECYGLRGNISTMIELDHNTLVIGSSKGELLLVSNDKSYKKMGIIHTNSNTLYQSTISITCLAPINDREIVIGYENGVIIIWDVKVGLKKFIGCHPGSVLSIVLTKIADEYIILSSASNKSICFWSLPSGSPSQEIVLPGHSENYILKIKNNIIIYSPIDIIRLDYSKLTPGFLDEKLNPRFLFKILLNLLFLGQVTVIKKNSNDDLIVAINNRRDSIIYILLIQVKKKKVEFYKQLISKPLVDLAILPNNDIVYLTQADSSKQVTITIRNGKTGELKNEWNYYNKTGKKSSLFAPKNGSIIVYSETYMTTFQFSTIMSPSGSIFFAKSAYMEGTIKSVKQVPTVIPEAITKPIL